MALITGIAGQDVACHTELLLEKGYEVLVLDRNRLEDALAGMVTDSRVR